MESSEKSPACGPLPEPAPSEDSGTLKYQLLGPSLTKAGQDSVDQLKVRLMRLYLCSAKAELELPGIGDYLQCLQGL